MKKKLLIYPLSIMTLFALMGCTVATSSSANNGSTTTNESNTTSSDESTTTSSEYGNAYDYNSEVSIADANNISVEEVTNDFEITTTDGTFSKNGAIYTITTAGTYNLTGKLTGQVVIDAGDDDEVVLELNNTSITYSTDSPIKALNAKKVEISALKDTGNTITDNRSAKTTDIDSQGEGAIYSDVDLKLKGSGTLIVVANYNNGVHTSKDLTVQKETLKVTAYNNALRGKNSVTIESGYLVLEAKTGNGIKTTSSEVTSKGKQKGTITINGGNIYVDSLHDAIDAAYDVVIDETDAEVETTLVLKTGKNASVYTKSFTSTSEKGIKAANEITINKGTIQIAAQDDAIHANYGDTLENSAKGLGNITINDGLIEIASGDDGLHADNTLTVNGGKILVTGATEGYEANYITINGGYSYIYGTDDGVNCSKKSFSTCTFTMNDGYLDVAVKSGDTDGIDSNGNVYIKGGTIITRGSPGTTGSNMSTGLDVDGTCSMTGGTLIAFNGLEKAPSTGSGIYYAATSGSSSSGFGGGGMGPRRAVSTSSFSAGEYTLSGDGLNVSFTNDYQYGSFIIYSSLITSGSTYTLSRGSSTVLSWTQSSTSVTIS